MAFQIEPGGMGAMLAAYGEKPMPDPTAIAREQLAARTAQMEAQQRQALFPLQQQEAQLALKQAQFGEQERQQTLKERGMWQQGWKDALATAKPDETPEQIFARMQPQLAAAGMRPETIATIGKGFLEHGKTLAEIADKQATAEKTRTETAEKIQALAGEQREALGKEGVWLRDVGKYDPTVFEARLSNMERAYANVPAVLKRIQDIRSQAQESPEALKGAINGMITPKAEADAVKLKLEQAQAEEAGQKVTAGNYAAMLRDIQGAEVDPKTGTPTPQAWAQIRAKYKDVNLPPTPTKEGIDQLVRGQVIATEPAKLPEFDIAQYKKNLGVLGNDKYDFYLAKYAQSIGKTPAQLSFQEVKEASHQYAVDTQNPEMLALIMGQKGLQEQLTRAQVATLPTPEAIENMAKDLRSGDMGPQQFAELRSGRVSWGPQVIEAARKQAAAEGKPFSMATLESQFKTRESTETAFATGPEAGMIRSFDNLMQHTSLLNQARKALTQSDLPTLRSIANAIGVQAGSTAETTYDTIADFVAAEAGKAFLPSGGGEAERAKNYSHFQRGLGDAQISSNINALMHLADSQRQGLERQYAEGTFGKGSRIGNLFSPQALAARDQLMGKTAPGGGGRGQTGGGQYKATATGPNGHKIGTNDVDATGKAKNDAVWYDTQTGKRL